MADKQERFDDIIAEMRKESEVDDFTEDGILGQTLHSYADRLKAAHNREVDEVKKQFGNEEKMRVWLERLNAFMQLPPHTQTKAEALNMIRAALAAPARNCDVGTEEEQSKRFDRFCDLNKYVGDDGANWCSQTCPCYNALDCGVKWAQIPYEEGGAK